MTQRLCGLLLVATLLVLLNAALVQAQDGGDPDREQAILDRLALLNPDAVPLFEQATRALGAGRLDEAQGTYEEVLALVPDFPDALRRLSYIALQQKDHPRALALAEHAYDVDPTPLNRATYAAALLTDDTQVASALSHAREAAQAQPGEHYIVNVYLQAALIVDDSADLLSAGQMLTVLDADNPLGYYYAGVASLVQGDFEAAISFLTDALERGFQPAQQAQNYLARAELGQGLARDDPTQVERAAQTLIAIAPFDATGYFYLGLAHAEQEAWRAAETALERARELGWSEAEIDALLDTDIRAEAAADRRAEAIADLLYALGFVLLGWADVLVLLLGAGAVLSRRVMIAQDDISPSSERSLSTTLYRAVIGLAALYYALTPLLLALISIGLAVGTVYGAVILDRFPAPIALVLFAAAIWTLQALIRSGLARAPAPGKALTRAEAPDLWALADEVAARLNTPPVDAITLTPYTAIILTVRGGLWHILRHRGQRHLNLGLGVLSGLTQGQLAALLAHDIGKSADGRLMRWVQAHTRQTARNLRARGLARWHNPVWFFLQVYYRVFTHITRGALRVQEALADEAAARSYGPDQFQAGLTHLIRQTLIFEAQLDRAVRTAAAEQHDLRNLWTLPPLDDAAMQALERTLAQMLARPASAHDHHRAPQDRFARIAHITPAEPVADRPTPAWNLLPDPNALTAAMTRIVQARLRERKIHRN